MVGNRRKQTSQEYGPRRILGVDIDEHLVGVARKNIRHYCGEDTKVGLIFDLSDKFIKSVFQLAGKFPASFREHGGGEASSAAASLSVKFPDNVWFRKENFVLECDEYLEMVRLLEFSVL